MKTNIDKRGIPVYQKVILFLASQNVSLFGSSVVGFAIMAHYPETSSGFWLMLATICYMVPMIILWGGVWAVGLTETPH